MGRARESLLDAAFSFRTRPEDRLTEIVATVVSICPAFAAALFKLAGLKAGDRFDVQTQLVTVDGKPVMAIDSRTGIQYTSRLWCEHKIDARDQDRQLERYAEGLRRQLAVDSKLLYIVRDVARTRRRGTWTAATWQQIGEIADNVGRANAPGGREWQALAVTPDSPAQWRLLHELLWYLAHKEPAVIKALEHQHVDAYKHFWETIETMSALLDSAARHAQPLKPSNSDKGRGAEVWVEFEEPDGSWLSNVPRYYASAQLVVSDRDRWVDNPRGEPAFAAGYAIEEGVRPLLEGRSAWLAVLEEHGFGFELWDSWLCIFKTKPMSELVNEGTSLQAQAEALGWWAHDSILELGELDPGEFDDGRPGSQE